MISEEPNSSGKILNALNTVSKEEESKPTPMTPEDSLKFLIDHNLTKKTYGGIKKVCK